MSDTRFRRHLLLRAILGVVVACVRCDASVMSLLQLAQVDQTLVRAQRTSRSVRCLTLRPIAPPPPVPRKRTCTARIAPMRTVLPPSARELGRSPLIPNPVFAPHDSDQRTRVCHADVPASLGSRERASRERASRERASRGCRATVHSGIGTRLRVRYS